MNILVINCGSSSLKYQLLDMRDNSILAKGLVERIGLPGSMLTHQLDDGEKEIFTAEIPNHEVAARMVLEMLIHPEWGAIKSFDEIAAIGHRVVHGGEKFSRSVIVTDEVIAGLNETLEIAPLHAPPNIAGIEACRHALPEKLQVVVFDTAFHQSMPPHAYLYGLPYELYEKYKIRRYGFHGTSHKYVSQRAAVMMDRPLESLKLISCHLGSGASITAIRNGRSVETSMGFTPLEGLMMGTRSGNLDPTVVSFIMKKEGMSADEVNNFLNKKCGVLGVSGISSDFRDIQSAAARGNYRAQLALDIFTHDVKKYIGSYAAILDGVDGIIFTAGLGENSSLIREMVCNKLDYIGVHLDAEKNKVCGEEMDISAPDATCRALVIPTNEELMIALETAELVRMHV